jgi:hypothetical protein
VETLHIVLSDDTKILLATIWELLEPSDNFMVIIMTTWNGSYGDTAK